MYFYHPDLQGSLEGNWSICTLSLAMFSFFQGDSGEFVRFLTERRDSNALVKGFCWEHGRWKYAGSGTERRLGGVTCDSFQKGPFRITIVERDGLVRKPRFNVISQET